MDDILARYERQSSAEHMGNQLEKLFDELLSHKSLERNDLELAEDALRNIPASFPWLREEFKPHLDELREKYGEQSRTCDLCGTTMKNSWYSNHCRSAGHQKHLRVMNLIAKIDSVSSFDDLSGDLHDFDEIDIDQREGEDAGDVDSEQGG